MTTVSPLTQPSISPPLKIQDSFLLLTPERSVPSSPTLSAAVVIHTNATTKHLHSNDDPSAAVDYNELTRLLHKVASSNKDKKSTTPSTRTSSTTSSNNSVRRLSCLNPNTPPQFVFKKPLYNQHYHQTHFHHQQQPQHQHQQQPQQQPQHQHQQHQLTPTQTNHPQHFMDLKRFFGSSNDQHEQQQPFANQFRQNVSGRYGQWGKVVAKEGI